MKNPPHLRYAIRELTAEQVNEIEKLLEKIETADDVQQYFQSIQE